MKNNKILFIIPAYNEEKCIANTCKSILEYNKKNKTKYDYVIINDGSTDNTEEVLKENNLNHIRLINNLGIGGAVQTGYKYALENGYDIAIQFDGDGQHDVGSADKIITPIIKDEADMVIGSRFIDSESSDFKSSGARRLGIKAISSIIKLKTGKKIYDTTSGFRAVNSDILNQFAKDYPTEYPEPISTVKMINTGYKVTEIPVKMHERKTGKSSIGSWKNVYFMINVFLSILLMKGTKIK